MQDTSITRPVLCRFQEASPEFQRDQGESLQWLAAAHARSEMGPGEEEPEHLGALQERFFRVIERFGCGPDKIATRRTEIDDFSHQEWSKMKVYPLDLKPAGVSTQERMRFYSACAEKRVCDFFSNPRERIHDLFHVSCTGYTSPSATQRAIAKNQWWDRTRNTHVYHMGCYAAFPAVRLARAALSEWQERRSPSVDARYRADIVHTELCTLHLNTSLHSAEQIVVQSLFADGHIKYSLEDMSARSPHTNGPYKRECGLEILNMEEMIVPESLEEMTWDCGHAGFSMTLSRQVPTRISGSLDAFLHRLFSVLPKYHSIPINEIVFAIHPGGPKIIDKVAEQLSLKETQIEHSRGVLRERGNMSSATLPHVWARCLQDSLIPVNTYMVSMAFGPGLSMYGSLMKKVELS